MTTKKKRLLLMVLIVCVTALVLVFLGDRAIFDNRSEFDERCRGFAGIWTDKDNTIALEIRRVTSDTLFFSLDEKRNRLFCARAVGDESYEFTYSSTGNEYQMSVHPGTEKKLVIQLLDHQVKLNFPGGNKKKQRPAEFNGILTNKRPLRKQKAYSLSNFLGTKKKPSKALDSYCTFSRLEDGTIWRVHALLDETGEYFKTDIFGITMNSTLSECKKVLGEMTSEESLTWNGIRRRYEKKEYISTIVTNEFGVIVEMDCQLKQLPAAKREGEFFMKGNTIYRFAGDYLRETKIELPKRCNRISSHAFDAGEHGYSLNEKRKYTRSITIPKNVVVEADAFANCGSLNITIEEGTKVIPKDAFAHMISEKSKWKKIGWVNVTLPSSLERVEEKAFAVSEPTQSLSKYWNALEELTEGVPVRINAKEVMEKENLTYIGDNAFWGIPMKAIPPGISYLGRNYTLDTTSLEGDTYERKFILPPSLKRISAESLYLLDYIDKIILPAGLKELQNNGIYGREIRQFEFDGTPKYFKQENTIGRWIRSKDGRILYASDEVFFDSRTGQFQPANGDAIKLPNKYYQIDRKHVDSIEVNVPEGILEIQGRANFSTCRKITLPKSLKKVNVEGIFAGEVCKVVFLGNQVPEFVGSCRFYPYDDGFRILVKKGLKKKMLHALANCMSISEKDLEKYITTF